MVLQFVVAQRTRSLFHADRQAFVMIIQLDCSLFQLPIRMIAADLCLRIELDPADNGMPALTENLITDNPAALRKHDQLPDVRHLRLFGQYAPFPIQALRRIADERCQRMQKPLIGPAGIRHAAGLIVQNHRVVRAHPFQFDADWMILTIGEAAGVDHKRQTLVDDRIMQIIRMTMTAAQLAVKHHHPFRAPAKITPAYDDAAILPGIEQRLRRLLRQGLQLAPGRHPAV